MQNYCTNCDGVWTYDEVHKRAEFQAMGGLMTVHNFGANHCPYCASDRFTVEKTLAQKLNDAVKAAFGKPISYVLLEYGNETDLGYNRIFLIVESQSNLESVINQVIKMAELITGKTFTSDEFVRDLYYNYPRMAVGCFDDKSSDIGWVNFKSVLDKR